MRSVWASRLPGRMDWRTDGILSVQTSNDVGVTTRRVGSGIVNWSTIAARRSPRDYRRDLLLAYLGHGL